MTRQDDIRNLIRNHNRRLQKLKEQQALHGLDAPPKILLEIEDIETELEQLQTELIETENDTGTLEQRVEQQRQRIATGLAEIHRQAAEEVQLHPAQKRLPVIGRPPLGVVDHFKDRIREREQIGQLLAEPTTRLVSVIGHGGMGKTALASKVLRGLEQHRWPHTDDDIPLDGIVYLSTRTAGISLERLFLDCAKMLGGEPEKKLNTVWTNPKLDIEEKVSHLLDALGEGRFVILLDNMEDLLDDKGQLVDADLQHFFDHSLTAAHGVRLLVTSRLALAFGREVMRFDRQVKLLDGLPTPDGVALLRELDPNGDYGLQDAPEEQLAQAVELVHGVPRALEVMAGILANDPFASLTEVIEQFYKQEDVVQALIEENYKRLDDNARHVIEALAVFKRPVLSLAVDYLLEPFVPGLDVPGIVRRLMHTNIVSIDRATKTVALHPIDQDYAYSQLSKEGEYTRAALERRAADYYAQLRTSPETWKRIDDLEPQLAEFEHRVRAGNYDDACEVINLIDADYLLMWGHYTRLVEMRVDILEGLNTPALRMINLHSLGNAYRPLGKSERAINLFRAALNIAHQIGNRRSEMKIVGKLGSAYNDLGQLEQALQFNKKALFIANKIGDRKAKGEYLGYLGWIYYRLGDFKKVIEFEEHALEIAHQEENHRLEGAIWATLGKAYHALGKLERAVDCFERAMCLADDIGDRTVKGDSLVSLGNTYYALGQFEFAIKHYRESLASARKSGHRRGEVNSLSHLGTTYSVLGQVKQAIKYFEEALRTANEIGDQWGKSYCLLGLGKGLLATDDIFKAQEYVAVSLKMDMPETNCQAALTLGIVLLHQHNPSAKDTFSDAVARCQVILDETVSLYEARYTLATVLVGQAACVLYGSDEIKPMDLFTPALTEYQRALEICDAPGVIQSAIRDLELIQAAGIEGMEPVFELLKSTLEENDN